MMSARIPRPGRRAALVILAGMAAFGLWGLSAPMTTRQGVNFQISTYHIPGYVKAIDFLHRHYQYEDLARRVAGHQPTEEARAMALYAWTTEHIRPTPKGWPIVDDHILNIMIRGYGVPDQMADVFTTLATYAGLPAFMQTLNTKREGLELAFVRIDGEWRVFDVANHYVFRDEAGRLLSIAALRRDPWLAARTTGPRMVAGVPYPEYFTLLDTVKIPRTLRAQLQMPWPRLSYEARIALGLERRCESQQ